MISFKVLHNKITLQLYSTLHSLSSCHFWYWKIFNNLTRSFFSWDFAGIKNLNVHKTFSRRLGRLLNVLCTSNLPPVYLRIYKFTNLPTGKRVGFVVSVFFNVFLFYAQDHHIMYVIVIHSRTHFCLQFL